MDVEEKTPIIELCWIGDAVGRLFGGIKDLKPDEIYPIIESRDSKWREYHSEKLEKLKKWLGKPFEESIRPAIVFTEDVDEKGFMGKLILKMFMIMHKIQDEYRKSVVVFDVTAAPASVMLIAPLICELLSGINTSMIIQYVCGEDVNDPIYHAAKKSKYYKKHFEDANKTYMSSLGDFNQKGEEEKESIIRRVRYPRFKFTLFGNNLQDLAKQIYFLNLPASDTPMLRADDVQKNMSQQGKDIIYNAACDRLKIEKALTKEDHTRIDGSISIWRTRTIQEFSKIALVESQTIGRNIFAKRSYAGDLFVPTIVASIKKSNLVKST